MSSPAATFDEIRAVAQSLPDTPFMPPLATGHPRIVLYAATHGIAAQVPGGSAQAMARMVVSWAQDYDAILCPALAEPPVTLGTIDSCSDDPMGAFARGGQFTPFTAISNATGSPAISVPLYQNDELGLPLGVQFIGKPWAEATLLRVAGVMEEAARPRMQQVIRIWGGENIVH